MDHVTTYLEMHSATDLRPGRPLPPSALVRPERDPGVIRELQNAVAAPHGWRCLEWSDERWSEELARPALRHWTIAVDGEPAGLVAINCAPGGDHEIDAFGLVPTHVGRGLGGGFLTEAVRLAWSDGARRVWLHTSSRDHHHALANYQARGFRIYRTETRPGTA